VAVAFFVGWVIMALAVVALEIAVLEIAVLEVVVLAGEAAGDHAVPAARVEVGEQDGDGFPDETAAVDDEAEAAQREPRVLKIE
jgi:hypothetical protein